LYVNIEVRKQDNPTIKTIRKIMKALNVPLRKLLKE